MKRAISSFAAIAFVSAMATAAMAQNGALNGVPNSAPLAKFDNGYLDQHPEVARQLANNPGLANNPQYLASHHGLQNYLAKHPGVQTDLQQHPERFMQAESRYQGMEGNRSLNGVPNSAPLSKFDNGYLDQHQEVAHQLANNPGLANNQQYLDSHPGLQNYLTKHPGVQTKLAQHPDRFMQAESRYEHVENNGGRHAHWGMHPFRNGRH